MNSYRCPQCDLLNWANTDCCKRCRLPNPANAEPQQFSPTPFMQNTMAAAAPQTAVQMPFVQPQNFQQPNYQPQNYQTPPQFQQERAGSYSTGNAPHYSNQYQPQNNYAVNSEEIQKAEKNVRNGFIGGIVWASLLAFATVVMMMLPSLLAGSVKSSPNGDKAMQGVEMVSKVMVAILGVMTVVIGGLSFGIRKKSMACAVILTVISGLGVLSSLIQMRLGGILFSVLMFGLMIAAAGGINTLKKYDLA